MYAGATTSPRGWCSSSDTSGCYTPLPPLAYLLRFSRLVHPFSPQDDAPYLGRTDALRVSPPYIV